MTPEQAAALWQRLESTGLRLGSPAWFTDFCAGPPGCPYSALFTRSGAPTQLGTLYSPQS
jgi:hypothetical protein